MNRLHSKIGTIANGHENGIAEWKTIPTSYWLHCTGVPAVEGGVHLDRPGWGNPERSEKSSLNARHVRPRIDQEAKGDRLRRCLASCSQREHPWLADAEQHFNNRAFGGYRNDYRWHIGSTERVQ